MLQLVGKETYEKVYELEDEQKEKWPVFVLKKLSAGEVNSMDDQLTIMKGEPGGNKITLLVGTARKLKIKYALVGWRNVVDENGAEASCTDATKDKLPSSIQTWLETNIDEVNSLKGVSKEKRKN